MRAALLVVCATALSALPAVSHARAPASIRSPTRLTAGEADQFLGVLGPKGKTLYFVSNRNATAQVFRQALGGGTPALLFSDAADVSWPRPSPDGKKILYISTRDDATGDVCTRDVDGSNRRCLTDATSAENQAFWFSNGDVGVVSRVGLHGDLRLRRLRGKGPGQPLVDRNLGSPSVSADGHWLVYVPLVRRSKKVGVSFAMSLGKGLHVRRLDKPRNKALAVRFDLPGTSGFPTFSPDGRYLYFSQHLSDTNRDGHIDGDDHSVLFRVRFRANARDPIGQSKPEQLTSALWNCQYPAPSHQELIATCLQHRSLDIYTMPLDGAVPAVWRRDKLQQAFDSARDPWERLLLLDHLRHHAKTIGERVVVLRRMSEQHLRLGELSSARWFANRADGVAKRDRAVRSWAAVMRLWIDHLRDERRLDHGELDDKFVASQLAHIRRLGHITRGAPLHVRTLGIALKAEILDVIGREGAALATLRQLRVAKLKDAVVLETIAERVPNRLVSLRKRPSALKLLAKLAEHKRLPTTTRLKLAERFVRLLVRGLPQHKRAAVLKKWPRKKDSDLAFRLDLELLLLPLNQKNQESVRKAVFLLYRHSREMPRRRALVSATVRRAAQANNAYLLYQFSNSWASWVRRNHAERAHAVALYRQVVMERAYIHWSKAEYGDARGSFYGVTLQDQDLEAWIGFFEMRSREGKSDMLKAVTRRFKGQLDHPVVRFLRAYDKAWTLSATKDAARRLAIIETAEAELAGAASQLHASPQFHHLRGYLAHQRLLASGVRGAAAAAHAHYLMALDLGRGNPRVLASVLHALGMLQGAVGNHHIALSYLQRRAKLPMMHPNQELSLRLARARSLAHIGRVKMAAKVARAAVDFVDATAPIEHLLPLALDRAALWSWAAGDHARAGKLYQRLEKHAAASLPASRARAHIVAAAAWLGAGKSKRALQALRQFDGVADTLTNDQMSVGLGVEAPALRWHIGDLRAIADGLRAQALAMNQDLPKALTALERRQVVLQRRATGGEVESWRLLAANWYHVASLRQRANQPARAALEHGLRAARAYAKETGTVAPDARLALLLAWSRVALAEKSQPDAAFVADLAAVYKFLGRFGHPSTAKLRATFGLQLTTIRLLHAASPSPSPSAR
ncbi:MAG: PD40 domain-containing protein [Myxococcales bacterium]|nr:PD40 domain-containing protein [Myxococcales bacterium]